MTRVSLSRLPGERVLVVGPGAQHEVALADLAAYVREREASAPRWVWDDTARWYPPLLAAGVRVARVHDLRLGRQLLRRAPAVDGRLLEGDEADHWDRLGPSAPSHPALFSVDDTAEHLRADREDARQLAAVAASRRARAAGAAAGRRVGGGPGRRRDDVRRGALALRRARVPAHRAARPLPPRGARPQRLEELAAEVRRALDAPGLNPDSRPDLLAALRRAGVPATDTRASSLRVVEHPAIAPLLRYKQLAHLFSTNGWAWGDQWVTDGPLPAGLPARRIGHRTLVVQRRRRPVLPRAGALGRGGRRRVGAGGRRRGPARAAGAGRQ